MRDLEKFTFCECSLHRKFSKVSCNLIFPIFSVDWLLFALNSIPGIDILWKTDMIEYFDNRYQRVNKLFKYHVNLLSGGL